MKKKSKSQAIIFNVQKYYKLVREKDKNRKVPVQEKGRKGTEYDKKELKKLLERLNFRVEIEENPSASVSLYVRY